MILHKSFIFNKWHSNLTVPYNEPFVLNYVSGVDFKFIWYIKVSIKLIYGTRRER